MNRYFLLILSLCFGLTASSQSSYWQQELDYRIQASWQPADDLLTAQCEIHYHNQSPDTLNRIYLHLWANAFSSKSTPFADQMLKLGITEFYFAEEQSLGGYQEINVTDTDRKEDMSLHYTDAHQEIAYIDLPQPLLPSDSFSFTIEYTLDIPKYFSRLGQSEELLQMIAWYPKPAVYDSEGWHLYPYLAMGEFYSEFGTYDVTIQVPEEYTVAHTGTAVHERIENGQRIIQSTLDNAHDFTWMASKNFELETRDITLSNGQYLHLRLYRKAAEGIWDQAMDYTEQAVSYMSDYMGDYPYPILSIVQSDDSGIGGAMEYPTLKVIKNVKDSSALEYYIAHEVAHSWFYAAMGSDERTESYFDEGLSTFLEQKYTMDRHGQNHYDHVLPSWISSTDKPTLRHLAEAQISRHMHQPLTTPVEELSTINYGLNAYQIGSTLIAHIESLLGEKALRDILRSFYQKWKYKHPDYDDLILHIESESGLDLNGYEDILAGKPLDLSIDLVDDRTLVVKNEDEAQYPIPLVIEHTDGSISRQHVEPSPTGVTITTAKDIRSAQLDPDHTSLDIRRDNNIYPRPSHGIRLLPRWDRAKKKEVYITPLIGYNSYDGLILGWSAFNSTIPAKDLKWSMTPFYGWATKSIVGQAWVSYDSRPERSSIRKIQYRLGVKSFHISNSDDIDFDGRYIRVDPAIIFHHHHSPASRIYSKTSLRQLWIGTEYFGLGTNGEVDSRWERQRITRLSHQRYDFNVLQPYELLLQAEFNHYRNAFFDETDRYVKLTLDYRQAFMYRADRSISFRLFASGFLYNTQRESSSYNNGLVRGSVSLLSQGFTDYSYDGYFIDRQGNAAHMYRQIGYHGGAFKDALGAAYSRIGQSNDMAIALNTKVDIPIRKIPLALFLDVGYLRTKSQTSDPLEGQMLYSGGVMMEFADGLFGVYLPLISSDVISNVYDIENRNLLSRITFSIDLHRFNPWDLVDDYNF